MAIKLSRRRVVGAGALGSLAALSAGCQPGRPAATDGRAPASASTTTSLASPAAPAVAPPAAGGSPVPTATAPVDPIVVGASVSTTGTNARGGEYQEQAYALWAEDVTQRGGLLGRPVTLVTLDDGSDPIRAQRNYEQLVEDTKVDLLLGPFANSVTQVVSSLTDRLRVPLVAAGANAPDIWKRGLRYIFGVQATTELYLHPAVELALAQGMRPAAMIGENTPLAAATMNSGLAYAQAKGLAVVVQERYPFRLADATPLLDRVKAAAPDALLGASYDADAILITRQAKARDLNVKLLALSVGAAVSEYQEALGPDAEYVIGTSTWEPSLRTPGNQEFVERFRQKWGREPTAAAAAGYAAGQALEAAVRQAGSLDRERLRAALAVLDAATILPGTYRVDGTGAQVGHTPLLVQWQQGARAIIWPDQYKTAEPRLPMPGWSGR